MTNVSTDSKRLVYGRKCGQKEITGLQFHWLGENCTVYKNNNNVVDDDDDNYYLSITLSHTALPNRSNDIQKFYVFEERNISKNQIRQWSRRDVWSQTILGVSLNPQAFKLKTTFIVMLYEAFVPVYLNKSQTLFHIFLFHIIPNRRSGMIICSFAVADRRPSSQKERQMVGVIAPAASVTGTSVPRQILLPVDVHSSRAGRHPVWAAHGRRKKKRCSSSLLHLLQLKSIHRCSWSYYRYAPAKCKPSICHLSAHQPSENFSSTPHTSYYTYFGPLKVLGEEVRAVRCVRVTATSSSTFTFNCFYQ